MRIVCHGPATAQRYLADALTESDHSVVTTDSREDAAYLAHAEHIDAIILLSAGGTAEAAAAVARSLAARPAHTLLVLIDRYREPHARVAALEAGADICLDHPYEYAELHARLLAFSRQTGPEPVACSASGSAPAVLSPGTRSLVAANGSTMLLRKREYLLMDRLLRLPGQVVGRDELIDYVFGDADADATSLHLLVSRLRTRLARARQTVTLVTVPRQGYRATVDTV